MAAVNEGIKITLEDAIHQRRSVRGYLDKRVPEDVLNKIFTLAQQSPSNCNIQPWKSFVASGEVRDRIRQELIDNVMNGVETNADYPYPGKFDGEYRTRQVDCAVEMYNTMGITREDGAGRAKAALRNFELFDAPHVVFIGMHKAFGATVGLDVGMYIQTLMLSMTAYGVSSCAQGSMRNYPDIVRREFPGNDDINILVGMSFGYEDIDVAANNTRIGRDDISASVIFSG